MGGTPKYDIHVVGFDGRKVDQMMQLFQGACNSSGCKSSKFSQDGKCERNYCKGEWEDQFTVTPEPKAGDTVNARLEDGNWYHATIEAVNNPGSHCETSTYKIKSYQYSPNR